MKTALISNPIKDAGFACAAKVAEYLLAKNAEVFSDKDGIFPGVKTLPLAECVKNADVVITVGGDGTILHTASVSAKAGVPLVGINLGKVGYMAEIEPDELALLDRLFDKNYTSEKRMLLDAKVIRDGKTVFTAIALNDAVISRGGKLRMSNITLYESDKRICDYVTDGLIFATPTGSTAYNLSAGGPITDPALDCIISTPICAHSLSNSRPIVFNPKAKLRCVINTDNEAYFSADGGEEFILKKNDEIKVGKSLLELDLIKLKEGSFYDKLAEKLR